MTLQTGAAQAGVEYLVILGLSLVAVCLGLYIVFQAYRGYRRNESRRMLYLAVGLALLTVVPFVVSILATAIGQWAGASDRTYAFYVPVLTRLLEISGLSVIVYSLYAGR
ncbi:MAG: DUF7521 family protein [Halobacteriota archaeon]